MKKAIIAQKLKTVAAALALLAAGATPSLAAPGTLYDELRANPQFSVLVDIIDANGLKANYTGTSPRTVFAPTNQAFSSIPGGYADMIKPTSPSVTHNTQALILYEIIPGQIDLQTLKGRTTTVTTLQGSKETIDGRGGSFHFGEYPYGAAVTGEPIRAANGLILPVDKLPVPVFADSKP